MSENSQKQIMVQPSIDSQVVKLNYALEVHFYHDHWTGGSQSSITFPITIYEANRQSALPETLTYIPENATERLN